MSCERDPSQSAKFIFYDLIADIPFWDDIVAHRQPVGGFNIAEVTDLNEIRQIDIDAQYDVTQRRAEQIFKRFQRLEDGDEYISVEAIESGLKSQGFILSASSLARLQSAMDVEKTGLISIQKAGAALQRLKLAELFSTKVLALERKVASTQKLHIQALPNGTIPATCSSKVANYDPPLHSSILSCTDYNLDSLDSLWPIEDLKQWFFARRPVKEKHSKQVRWVHMQGLDKIMLLRLAVKYRLHPLAIEDALEMCHQPAKVDKYAHHFFCAINALQLDEHTKSKIENDDEPPKVRIHCSYICMFVSRDVKDTVLTIHQNQLFEDQKDHDRLRRQTSDSTAASRKRLKRTPSFHEHDGTYGADIFHEVFRRLNESSRVRDNNSDFFMYLVLDKCVDELMPIIMAYDARLTFFQNRLKKLKTSFPSAWLDEISAIKLELMDFQRTVRPLNTAIKHILDDPTVCETFPMYVEDVQDHLEQVTEDARALIEVCACIAQDYNMFGDQKMNQTLYVLTIVTTIFIPSQFIAGMYGMNFVKPDGSPAIPELEWENGYAWFWGLIIGVSSFMILIFKCMTVL
eukprot:gnl/MRDRNA2_/MRDRNA2_91342_c0_seq1.p1 gnl/MRDRNA2_/MRDRNA2_91342_c0~~gnl/MRDRNA2_/MRDRNA2_91342_c0_seq1.p1  ORF type:complete len:592 (+),score=106.78 gnl/MRDRNA2_/MRDRNA2_91342_c0_seq1:55-1776(+)